MQMLKKISTMAYSLKHRRKHKEIAFYRMESDFSIELNRP